jgi:hypothetical protein
MKLAIICCYGVFDQEFRSEDEILGIQYYLDQVCTYILKNIDEYSKVVFAGGYTNILSHKSEAESSTNSTIPEELILIENCSHDLIENIVFSLLTARLYLENIDEIVIFCDNVRKLKVEIILDNLINKKKKVTVKSFERKDVHPNSNIEYQNSTIEKILQSEKYYILKKLLHTIIK